MSSNGSLRNVTGAVKFGLIKRSGTTGGSGSGMQSGSGSLSSKGKRTTLFDDLLEDDDSDDSNNNNSNNKSDFKSKANRELQKAAAAAATAKMEKEKRKALEEDKDIFDYDAAYDAMKEAEDARRRKRDLGETDSSGRKKPRYVSALLAASLQRKIELERVEDRKVAKERELEGGQFADKDAFVTEAYKKRQEELRLLEEEERRNQAKATGGDMAVFYRSLLDEHEQVSSNAHLSKEDIELAAKEREQREREKKLEEQEKLDDAVRRGELKINANNEIVDKRALLRSGLNISKTKVRTLNEEREADERDKQRAEQERRAKEREERDRKKVEFEKRKQKEEQARRLLEETESQKRESERKRALDVEKEKQQVAATMAKKATEEVVLDARARYLARKKAQEEEAAKNGGNKNDDDSD
ncbi:UNVERIFIED_CONTAM: hypothetical protein HDU68_007187 [Siphonaria sp. JEL0065]|nr:hypothetical protein HDU68_007187 [Siphonaria sp. JEL0065]